MLFNSYIFIFAFLPITLAVFYGLKRYDARLRIYWLVLASFFFYGWWSPPYVLLLALFVVANFAFGRLIEHTRRKIWLVVGICFNLSLILYYKYFYFLLSQFMSAPDIETLFPWASPLLPLGISFFTFQKIAYLVDTWQRKVVKHTFGEYALFVSFFPQLIAGPIVHQKEILPQLKTFTRPANMRWIALGAACFILGLAKKTLLADPLGTVAEPLFEQSLSAPLTFAQGWLAALSYTLQLYFDFSGYSDMAIGLGLLFGIRLPLNFFSPYKATNIIDFWRRWHMTLSRFLRDYVYIPLGGSQKGPARRYINLMLTMLIGGLWHGAGWTFVLWGGLHGLFLCINHFWQKTGVKIPLMLSWVVTFMAVVFAWVLFRAETMESALTVWHAMLSPAFAAPDIKGALLVALGLFVALAMPNVHQWLRGQGTLKGWKLKRLPMFGRWQPVPVQGLALGSLLFLCLLLVQFVQAEFLYFNF
jgi:D-alanyl-lipoteichoic acid acyltransferase DltB (MBOAT superfamily)